MPCSSNSGSFSGTCASSYHMLVTLRRKEALWLHNRLCSLSLVGTLYEVLHLQEKQAASKVHYHGTTDITVCTADFCISIVFSSHSSISGQSKQATAFKELFAALLVVSVWGPTWRGCPGGEYRYVVPLHHKGPPPTLPWLDYPAGMLQGPDKRFEFLSFARSPSSPLSED